MSRLFDIVDTPSILIKFIEKNQSNNQTSCVYVTNICDASTHVGCSWYFET